MVRKKAYTSNVYTDEKQYTPVLFSHCGSEGENRKNRKNCGHNALKNDNGNATKETITNKQTYLTIENTKKINLMFDLHGFYA